jgi:MFS family permease
MVEAEEREEFALEPGRALYGTGFTAFFSDNLNRRYVTLLAASVGVTVSQMSWLRAAQSLSQNLLQMLWGRLIDRYGKRIFLSVGRILNGIALGALIFFQAPSWLIPLVIASAICWSMMNPAWRSLIGDYTTQATRGEVIGGISAVGQLGGLVAMILAFFISLNQVGETTPESYIGILAMAASMSVVSGILSLFTEEKVSEYDPASLDILSAFRDRILRRYLIVNIFFGIGLSFAWPFFPFIIVDKLGLKIWQIAAYSICSSAASALSQRYLGRMMDNVGRRPVIIFSRISMSVAPLVYVFATDWTHVVIGNTLLGLGMGAWMSSGPTYIIDMAPRHLRATYLAANTAIFGVSTFAGNLISGYLADYVLAPQGGLQGIHAGLLISAFLRLTTGLTYIWIHETHEPLT